MFKIGDKVVDIRSIGRSYPSIIVEMPSSGYDCVIKHLIDHITNRPYLNMNNSLRCYRYFNEIRLPMNCPNYLRNIK